MMIQKLKQLVRDHDASRITDEQFRLGIMGILCFEPKRPMHPDVIQMFKTGIRNFQLGGEG